MMNKEIFSRIQHKHDTKEHWALAANFVPKLGEIIIYDPDEPVYYYDDDGEEQLVPGIFPYSRFKIGDGKKTVSQLGFYMEEQLEEKITEIWQAIADLNAELTVELNKKLEGDVVGRTLNLNNNIKEVI